MSADDDLLEGLSHAIQAMRLAEVELLARAAGAAGEGMDRNAHAARFGPVEAAMARTMAELGTDPADDARVRRLLLHLVAAGFELGRGSAVGKRARAEARRAEILAAVPVAEASLRQKYGPEARIGPSAVNNLVALALGVSLRTVEAARKPR